MSESYLNTSTAAIKPPVVGLDGHSPVYQPDSRWTIFAMYEIYLGRNGLQPNGKPYYVPKVNDYVIDPETYATYICKHIDPVTLIPRLEQIRPANMVIEFVEQDILFGISGNDPNTYRVYLDTSVLPHTLAVDARLKVGGSMVDHCKLFRGTDLGGNGEVISRTYDASGNIVTDKVAMEVIAIDSHVNYAIKSVAVCHTNVNMNDGELVTAVFYDNLGKVVSKRQLLVENTGFIRGLNASQKYVSHISLESPFISPTLDHVIEFPLNIPLNALNLMGVVHYSDGSKLRLPVDGSKFRIYGLDQFVSTIIGQKIELVLTYQLANNETAYGVSAAENKCVTEPYSIVVVEPNNSLAVKVYGYPVWVDDATGYRMQFWLLNLDRNIYFNVTPYVTFAENTGAFDPRGFGYLQRKAITLNLRDVSGGFKPMIHTQLMDIVLNLPNGRLTPWTVSHESLGDRPNYGDGLVALRQLPDRTKFKLDCNCANLEEWLNRFYYATYPLVDKFRETRPPAPTHFEIMYAGRYAMYHVNDWNTVLTLGIEMPTNSTIFIKFIKHRADLDMQLSVAAILVGE
jgi:hypothetical protein